MGAAFNALVETTKFFETNPDKFIKRALARDSNGYDVNPADPSATCFCTVGYMARILGCPLTEDAYDFVQAAINEDDRSLPSQGMLVQQNDDAESVDEVVQGLKAELADA